MQKVDVVYTYVDGNDPAWLDKKINEEKQIKVDISSSGNSARFMDNQELKFSLRSIDKYADWVNKIFIVTDNQIPSWLNFLHPKIRIIDHTDIFSKRSHLPNFNAKAIETQIHHIKDLSEYFIYFNDDMFLGRKTKPEDFFNKSGKPNIFVSELIPFPNKTAFNFELRSDTKKNDYQESVIRTRILYKNHFRKNIYYNIRHGVKPLLKSVLEKLETTFPDEVNATANNKFRTGNDLMMLHLCQFYCIDKKLGKPVYLYSVDNNSILKKIFTLNSKNSFFFINLDDIKVADKFEKLRNANALIFCLNQTPKTLDSNLIIMKNFLADYFPVKSQFEN